VGAAGRIIRIVEIPLLRRLAWHFGRVRGQVDRRLLLTTLGLILSLVLLAATIVTVVEGDEHPLGKSFYWALNTLLGSGDTTYVSTPVGYLVSWLLIFLGLVLLGIATGVLIAFMIDLVLKEGRGMGAAGFRGHIVVCGWNANARELVEELRGDDYQSKIVLVHPAERNPAGTGLYFVSGDPSNTEVLARAGIQDAMAAVVFPDEDSDAADMRSILVVMAIESVAPDVRTIAEVNNPRFVEHFRRAKADEVLVPSRLASHLLARSALYPGLTELVTDIVSGGTGSELYRVRIPDSYLGLSIDQISSKFRTEHRATLLSISRGGVGNVNPPADFRVQEGDDALVVAESLGTLAPLQLQRTAAATT
jgi:voltage-gated potassium channel